MSASSPYQPPGSEPTPASELAPTSLNLRDPVGRVRAVGVLEGLSFLILLGVCMPLKYLAGQPLGVQIVGPIHGGLFLLYLLVITLAWANRAISFRDAVLGGISSVLPFGPFVFDRRLARESADSAG